ncbi:orotidine 5'-phosphate decarboxylase / HUMPS family protein [Candidatus Borrarchaeum sp.]|uniref:orotidine 5'-phosphate decarboxylase / HUMPS family protein n=1 Tax=Candidatus Borrarchaeum sp. TaxID=2846742 RepID=UPI00257D5E24|nr:orotidine 5'-phosphate decarboxylase / HUMPS family protein [Candidatus Borrarchaeum sp.]
MTRNLFHLKYGIIPACDVKSLAELENLVELTADIEGIVGYKIGFSLGLSHGLSAVVDKIKRHTDLPIIYDHQKAGTDIPQMGELFARTCSESGVTGVIIFPQAGPVTEEAFIRALFNEGLTPLVGGEMTHQKYLDQDGGFIRNESIKKMYLYGAKNGVEYFIVPGNKPEKISGYVKLLKNEIPQPMFCMPGIGRQGGDIKSAFEATEGLPAYGIIGRAIYAASDIRKAAKKYCAVALES